MPCRLYYTDSELKARERGREAIGGERQQDYNGEKPKQSYRKA